MLVALSFLWKQAVFWNINEEYRSAETKKKTKKNIPNNCAKRGIKVVTDFLQFDNKIKVITNVLQVSKQIEKPNEICKNQTYDILLIPIKFS